MHLIAHHIIHVCGSRGKRLILNPSLRSEHPNKLFCVLWRGGGGSPAKLGIGVGLMRSQTYERCSPTCCFRMFICAHVQGFYMKMLATFVLYHHSSMIGWVDRSTLCTCECVMWGFLGLVKALLCLFFSPHLVLNGNVMHMDLLRSISRFTRA